MRSHGQFFIAAFVTGALAWALIITAAYYALKGIVRWLASL